MPTVTLVKPARFIARSVSGGSSSMRLSIENWIFCGQPADLLDEAGGPLAAETEKRVAKLERAKAPAANALPNFLHDRLRFAKARGVIQHQVGAVVALEAATAAGLDQARRESPEIVADAEPRRPQGRPIGQRQAIEIFDHAQLHLGPRLGKHFVQPPEQLLGLALHDGHARSANSCGRMLAAVPTTSTRACGSSASSRAMTWRSRSSVISEGLKT